MNDLVSKKDAIIALLNKGQNSKRYKLGETWELNLTEIEDAINNMPSADAVEVVRCKDCKWHINGHLCKQLSQYGSIETPPSFYCQFGKRRENLPSAQPEQEMGHWEVLDECSNEGVYCSNCHKKVFKLDFSNTMKWKNFKFCPNCGKKMEETK